MKHPITDTHVHVWNFERAEYGWLKNDTSILKRTYHIEEIEAERENAGITAGVLVQASINTDDTDWMLEVAEKTPWIQGVVGWLPLTDPVKTAQLLNDVYLKNKYYKGVRHLIHDEADPTWLLQESVIESLKILVKHHLTYDVVGVLPEHIRTVLTVAEKVPELKMVFDHLNAPPVSTGLRFGEWGDLMKAAAANKNFHAKISGLGTVVQKEQNWSAADIQPYVEFVLEQFGIDRCFCGGDWPVSLLAGSYTRTWDIYKELITSSLNDTEAAKIFSGNAQQFYKLTS